MQTQLTPAGNHLGFKQFLSRAFQNTVIKQNLALLNECRTRLDTAIIQFKVWLDNSKAIGPIKITDSWSLAVHRSD